MIIRFSSFDNISRRHTGTCGQDTASPLFTPYPTVVFFSFPWLRNMQNSNNMPFSDCISRLICI